MLSWSSDPKSRSVRIYGEVDLLEPTDPVEPETLLGYKDPHTRAAVMIVLFAAP
jgi:hypothetical protein